MASVGDRHNGGVGEFLSRWVPILVIIIGVGVAWGRFEGRLNETGLKLDELTRRVGIMEGRIAASDVSNTEIKIKLAEIARDITYIRQELERGGR